MGIQKGRTGLLEIPTYYLMQRVGPYWERYSDYSLSVQKPGWLPDMAMGNVRPLSDGTRYYDYVRDLGHSNIGKWVDNAAVDVGR